MSAIVDRRISLACSPERAFTVFTRHVDLWWPRGHRRTSTATIILEPVEGGRLLERAPDGDDWVIGRLTRFEPSKHLAFDWFPGSPAAPTAVDASFSQAPGGSEIHIVHRALTPGAMAAWTGKVALFERGWDTVLPALKQYIEQQGP